MTTSRAILVAGAAMSGIGLVLNLVGGEMTPLGSSIGLVGSIFVGFGIFWPDPKPKVLGPMKTARMKVAQMTCCVCDKPLVDNELVVYQEGEDPIHEACHRAHPDD